MKRYSDLFFDLDDTILDFGKSERNAFIDTCNDFGIVCTDYDYTVYSDINLSLWKKYEKGEIQKSEILVLRFKQFCACKNIEIDCKLMNDIYKKHLAKQVFFIDGALEGLIELKKHYRLSLISNGTLDVQTSRLKLSGLNKIFDNLFLSDPIGYCKPEKEFFDYCFSHCNATKETTLVIGDSDSSDIKGAYLYGIDAIFFNYRNVKSNYPFLKEVFNWKELIDCLTK